MRSFNFWKFPPLASVSPELIRITGGDSLIAQILCQRGVCSPSIARAFLDPDYYTPALPEELPDLAAAANFIDMAIAEGKRILVWGDFDVDGQTAVAVFFEGLTALGAQVVTYIPHRLRESHGVLVESLIDQIDKSQSAVLLTCDTGVSAFSAIDYAKSRGVTTLITDHHDLPPMLPPADAVVNPKRLTDDHPLSTLPGVGVAYKLIEHLFRRYGRVQELSQYLDLVSLGIVADVARLTGDTRYLLQRGLQRLHHTERLGMRALAEVAGVSLSTATTDDIGFQLAPRLNAAGRLSDAKLAVKLLTTSDPSEAYLLASQLEGLNAQRRLLSQQIFTAAQERVASDPSLLDWSALVIGHPAWHGGVLGIVANQLAEHYGRPVVLFHEGQDGIARGSARSSHGYDIGAAIAAQADLLIQHGGHSGAAGLSLPGENIPAFRRRLSLFLETVDAPPPPPLFIDAEIAFEDIAVELISAINQLAPFGEGNPPVTFMTPNLKLKSATLFGTSQQHRRLTVESETGIRHKVIWWGGAVFSLPDGAFDLAFQLALDPRSDSPEPQLILVDFRRPIIEPIAVQTPERTVIDLRRSPAPHDAYSRTLEQQSDAKVWAEGFRQSESPGLPLAALAPASTLVVFTTPPGPQRFQEALEKVKPITVVLLGHDPPYREAVQVQRRVLELVKYVMNHQNGRTSLDALASAVGHAPETIRLAIEFSASSGQFSVSWEPKGGILFLHGPHMPSKNRRHAQAAFEAAVAETTAYRAFFQRATVEHLLPGWGI